MTPTTAEPVDPDRTVPVSARTADSARARQLIDRLSSRLVGPPTSGRLADPAGDESPTVRTPIRPDPARSGPVGTAVSDPETAPVSNPAAAAMSGPAAAATSNPATAAMSNPATAAESNAATADAPNPDTADGSSPATSDGSSPATAAGVDPGAIDDADERPTVIVRSVVPAADPQSAGDSSDAETTQVIRRVDLAAADEEPDAGSATEHLAGPEDPVATPDTPPPDGTDATATAGGEQPPRRRRILLVASLLIGLLAILYGGDLALGAGKMPRGVTVAGIPVGGLAIADAERELRGQIEPRGSQPVKVTVGDAGSEIDPKAAGLSVDWPGTIQRAADQPLNPVTRISSLFTEREVGVASTTNQEALDAALVALGPVVDHPPTEGSVRFEGITPVPVQPVPGQQLDVAGAERVLQREWALGRPVALPLIVLPPITTSEDVAAAIDKVAKPAVSAPVIVTGEGGVEGTLTPEAITGVLSFRADPQGLVPEINVTAVTDALEPALAPSETPGRDASLDFSSGRPVVTPSKDGRGVDYEATVKDLLSVLTSTGDRKIVAVYADQPAELTTEEVNNLGITGVIGEFTTRGFATDSGKNIRRAAQVINGMIVEPGKTFSLNGATQPRNGSNGYVEAGIINDGHASRGVGGGVSQIATTLYNAAYFAGMVDVEHKEHSFYISRYPPGREATVFDNKIDMKFRNDNPTGVMIQTIWTPDSITVRLFGTKRYEVTSSPGPRTQETEPQKVTIKDGEPCAESDGAPGFTVTDTRTLREISTGQVRTETRTVKYNPAPIVECGDDD